MVLLVTSNSFDEAQTLRHNPFSGNIGLGLHWIGDLEEYFRRGPRGSVGSDERGALPRATLSVLANLHESAVNMNFEVLQSDVQGHSLVASHHFNPGELVMQEPILFSVATDRLGGVIKSRADAMLSMQQLSSEVFQEAFESARLSQDQLQLYSIIQGRSNLERFQIVSYDMCAEWSQTLEAFGYGEKGAYLNHSCESNLIYYWNPQEQQMQLRAVARISPCDELTVNYLAPEIWMTKVERQGDLKRLLKLDQCECRKCTGATSDVSDARIRYINEMEQTLATFVSGGHTLEHVSKLTENFVQQCELELGGKATSESTFPDHLDPRLIKISVSHLSSDPGTTLMTYT